MKLNFPFSFRQTTLCLGEPDLITLGDRAQTERAVSPSRPLTAFQEKMRGYIKGCMEYQSGPAFRDDVRINLKEKYNNNKLIGRHPKVHICFIC